MSGGRLEPRLDPERDHVRGEGPLELVEYGDYECPYSRRAQAAIEDVRALMGDRLRHGFRHLPIRSKHPHAQLAAEAAEAAAAQGRFWEMHRALLAAPELDGDQVRRIAAEAGLDVERFEAELESGAPAARVEEDVQSAGRSGADGTPTFFVSGRLYDGFYDAETLADALEEGVAEPE